MRPKNLEVSAWVGSCYCREHKHGAGNEADVVADFGLVRGDVVLAVHVMHGGQVMTSSHPHEERQEGEGQGHDDTVVG